MTRRELEREARRMVWDRYDGGPPQDEGTLKALIAAAIKELVRRAA